MSYYQLLRLIVRGWWRNKLFTVVAWGSLVIGILCVSLLGAFVLHEYRADKVIPDGERILRLTQQVSMGEQAATTFIYGPDVPQIVSAFPEIETSTRVSKRSKVSVVYRDETFSIERFMLADSTFLDFFPLKAVQGSWQEVQVQPDAIALEEKTALRIFGSSDCLGESLAMTVDGDVRPMVVKVVFRNPAQALLSVGALSLSAGSDDGEACFIKLREGTDLDKFRQKFAETLLPTVLGKGHLDTQTLHESYFDTSVQDLVLRHRSLVILVIGGVVALLVLLVACFNYLNLGLTRLLDRMRMLHIEVFAGASRKDIYRQLFLDTCLMIGLAFICSFLLMNDLLPLFNRLMDVELTMGYILSYQVLPWLLLGGIVLAGIPAFFISRKLQSLTESEYRWFYQGKIRRLLVSCFQGGQFVVTLVLFSVFLIIHSQLELIKKDNLRFEGVIDVYVEKDWGPPVSAWMEEARHWQGVKEVTLSETGLFEESMAIIGKSGNPEDIVWIDMVSCRKDFLDFYRLELIDSEQTARLLPATAYPVVVNETFVKKFVPDGINPIGEQVSKYLPDEPLFDNRTIVGVVRDFRKRSLSESVWPLFISLNDVSSADVQTLSVRVEEGRKAEVLKQLRRKWEEVYPDRTFVYQDIGGILEEANRDVVMLTDILSLYAAISLLLTFSGLFSLVRYTVRLRQREIALRKIHGASLGQIQWILSCSYVAGVAIAFLIAVPLVYACMLPWLEHFRYYAPISVSHFMIPLVITAGVIFLTVWLIGYKVAKMNPAEVIKRE
ncbi:FtsX-like permease family protein [Bacteroides sp. An19]|uniref:ABC transporter permease n=1 Tax=Bacteroides sp. An19 TaxID=1965580 RepID=UPI000B387DD0|nr:FtsX-like permease family protein [Bacteroides sp. An19]OUP30697.1 hypothetical protein B5F25_13660 [Bacteroides sp. An19]